MNIQELIDYIIEGRQHKAELALNHWLETSKRYYDFVYKYRDKIRSKFRNSVTDEDCNDVRFEIEIPYLYLLDDHYTVGYEKFGNEKKRSPDFTIQRAGSYEFNVEVKRVREAGLGTQYDEVIKKIIEPIRKTPSSLGFSIDVLSTEPSHDLVSRLEISAGNVTSHIRSLIANEEATMPMDKSIEYPLDGFYDEVNIVLSKPSGKKDFSKTSYYGGFCPIFFTNKECLKFGDTIFEKLGQCIEGMINILAITTNSFTHEPEDVLESIASINGLIRENNDDFFKRKGFESTDDFLRVSKNLSAIVFKTTWINREENYNLVWCNANAESQVPEDLKEYSKHMGRN